MATFLKRRRPDGTIAYRALVRVKRGGRVVYSSSHTFDRLAVARRWAQKLEAELADPEALGRRASGSGATVGALVRRYIREVDQIKPLGRTHRFSLEALLDWPLALKPAAGLRASDIVEHCRARQAKGAGPATVMQDVAFLRGPLGMARVAWNLPVSTQALDDARPLLEKLQLVARPHRRDRRPTRDELKRLQDYFRRQDEDSVIPMADIMEFALWSARRLGEICAIKWTDVDEKKRTAIVRDMKDPRHKKGNDLEFPLLGRAWDVLKRQPRIDERVFPYEAKSAGARYTRAKKALGIANLRFHDLRREAASRLFEAGYQIHEVAQVTGHRDISILWRVYTKLKPETLSLAKFGRRGSSSHGARPDENELPGRQKNRDST